MSTIEERVKKVVAERLNVKEEDIQNSSSFTEDLGADSLDTVELVMALEEEFGTEIPDEEAEKITTVQEAIDYVNAHRKGVDAVNQGGVLTIRLKKAVLIWGGFFYAHNEYNVHLRYTSHQTLQQMTQMGRVTMDAWRKLMARRRVVVTVRPGDPSGQ